MASPADSASLTLLLVGVAIVTVGLYKSILYPVLFSPLSKIPAARWHARIWPLYRHYIKYTNTENREIHKLHVKYGPVVLLGPSELSVNCCEGLKTIYNGDFPKTEWYFNRFSTFRTDNIFTTRDSKIHSQRKRLLSQAFSKSSVFSSAAIAETSSNIIFNHLFPILNQSSTSSTPVNIHPLDYAYAIDSFTAFQLGAKLGTNFVEDSKARNWFLHHFFAPRPHTVFWEVEVPRFTARLLEFGIRLIPEWCETSRVAIEDYFIKRYDHAAEIVTADSDRDMTETKSSGWPAIFAVAKDKYGRLGKSSFMTTEDKTSPPQPYHHRLQIASDMYDETAAAVETSGNALTFLHYELARNPDIQSALRLELQTLLPTPSTNPTPDLRQSISQLNLKTLDSLPLLDAILTETLRLYPPVGGPEPRITPGPGPCTISGHEGIPPGVRVQASAWSLHRNPEVFPEPEEWRPHRWMDASPDKLTEMRRWFWAFGSGARMCIGMHFAVISIKLVVAAIYLHFSSELGDKDIVLVQEDGYTTGPKGDELWLQLRRLDD